MDEIEILKKVGLNEAQARVYRCLLKNGSMSPTELAKLTNQSRENCYAITKKLSNLGLIEKTETKKTQYRVLIDDLPNQCYNKSINR